jgi:hypothetical protein
MAVVLIAALDCGLVRLFLATDEGLAGLCGIGLTMSAAVIGLLLGRDPVRRFARGFLVWTYALTVALIIALMVGGPFFPGTVQLIYRGYVNFVFRFVWALLPRSWRIPAMLTFPSQCTGSPRLPLFAVMLLEAALCLPLISLGLIGGLVALVLGRRKPSPAPDPNPANPETT